VESFLQKFFNGLKVAKMEGRLGDEIGTRLRNVLCYKQATNIGKSEKVVAVEML
jgi:hypothetical protein